MFRSSVLALLTLALFSSVAHSEPGDWLGAPTTPLTPTETPRELLGTSVDVAGARIYRLAFDNRQISPSNVFSVDGKYLYLLQSKVGVLQIEVPSFRLVRTLALPCNGGSIALSSEGLVVGSDDAQTVWIVSPSSLRVLRSLKPAATRFVTATPRSPLVFVSDGKNKLFSFDARGKGDIVGYQPETFQFDEVVNDDHRVIRLDSFSQTVLSPDADALYCASSGRIYRFTIQNRTLTPDVNSNTIAYLFSDNVNLSLSPDGRYVTLPREAAVSGFGYKDGPNLNETWIFKVNNLREPVLRLDGTVGRLSLGFDQTAGRLYVVVGNRGFDSSGTVKIFDTKGVLIKTLGLPSQRNDRFGDWNDTNRWPSGGWTNVHPISVHPKGNCFLMGGADGLYWVELPQVFTPTPDKPARTNPFNGEGFGGGGFGTPGKWGGGPIKF